VHSSFPFKPLLILFWSFAVFQGNLRLSERNRRRATALKLGVHGDEVMRRILWKGDILVAVITLTFWSGAQARSQHVEESEVLTVAVHDYAQVPNKLLRSAEQGAARVFRQAGIKVVWLDCLPEPEGQGDAGCERLAGRLHLRINILSRNLSAPFRYHKDTFGVAEVFANGIGSEAYIFYDRVEELSKNMDFWAMLLADLMAHELGHLLLGQDSHSPTGIMRAIWRDEDMQDAAQGALLFTSTQSKLMRLRLAFMNAQEMANLSALMKSP
jgi:hypothetical protein